MEKKVLEASNKICRKLKHDNNWRSKRNTGTKRHCYLTATSGAGGARNLNGFKEDLIASRFAPSMRG